MGCWVKSMDRHDLSAVFEKYWFLAHPKVVSNKEKQSQAQEEWRKKWKNAKAEEIEGRIGELKEAADEVRRKREGKKMLQTSLKRFIGGHAANLAQGTASSSQESPSQSESAATAACGISGPGGDSVELSVVGESSTEAEGIGEDDETGRKFPTPSQDRHQYISDGCARKIARVVEMKEKGIILSSEEKDKLKKWSAEKKVADSNKSHNEANARRQQAFRDTKKDALLEAKKRAPEVFEEVGLKIRDRPGRPAIEDDFPDFPRVRLLCFWKKSHAGGGGGGSAQKRTHAFVQTSFIT